MKKLNKMLVKTVCIGVCLNVFAYGSGTTIKDLDRNELIKSSDDLLTVLAWVEQGGILSKSNVNHHRNYFNAINYNFKQIGGFNCTDKNPLNLRTINALGECYYWEIGAESNFETAVELYKLSTDYSEAQNNLGNCYFNGKGIPQDFAKAVSWYEKAADKGL